MKDLDYLDKVIRYKTNDYFCWLYPFTNENIDGYYKYIDFNDRNVLTVTSSGDHALNAVLNGAKSVSSFDSNPLAKYYSELKVAGVKALSLDEFILFFYNKNLLLKQKYYFNNNIYKEKIRDLLDDKNKYFWDYVFNNYDYKSLYGSNLFSYDFLSKDGLIQANRYLNNEDYINLKDKLDETRISYYDCNISDINIIDKKFDLIILSNIFAIIPLDDLENEVNKFKIFLSNNLKDDGKVVFNYYYSNLLYAKKDDLIFNFDSLKDIYNEYIHEILTFESSVNLDKNVIFREPLAKDKVLILKK